MIRAEFNDYIDGITEAENNFSMENALGGAEPRELPSTHPLFAMNSGLYQAPNPKGSLTGDVKEEPMTA